MAALPDISGYIGVGLILTAYALLQIDKLKPDRPLYSILNGAGSAGILTSLWFDPNLPSIIVEGAWLIISLFGLHRSLFAKKD